MTVVRMDTVLWELGKFYHKKHLEDHPDSGVSVSFTVMNTLLALEENGDVVKHLDADGSVTWKATPKLLAFFEGGAGRLVAFGPSLH
jgi:hypothetical protein